MVTNIFTFFFFFSDSSDEDDLAPKPINSSAPLITSADFWGTMEPYISPFNPVDLKCLQPVEIPPDGSINIPALGKHYSLVLQDKGIDTDVKKQNNEISCGNLTQRLLASLLEVDNHVDTRGISGASIESCLPLDVPPTADYSSQKMENLEDRICMELRYIGLMDEVCLIFVFVF